MKALKLLFGLFFCFLISSAINMAYDIQTDPKENITINILNGRHQILSNGDLESHISMSLILSHNYNYSHKNMTIKFFPNEILHGHTSLPIKNITSSICAEVYGIEDPLGHSGRCGKLISSKNFTQLLGWGDDYNGTKFNYTSYFTTFEPQNSDRSYYIYSINYTTPKFIFKQGNYKVALLTLTNLNNVDHEKIHNSIILSESYDFPVFIPKDAKIARIYEGNGNYSWAYIFEGIGDKIIWYQNEKEIRAEQEALQNKYTFIGALLGLFVSVIAILIQDGLVKDRINANKKKR